MALSQQHRSAIYAAWEPQLGSEVAEALISQFPARDQDEPVTKDFVRAEISELRGEMQAGFGELRTEFRTEIGNLRTEFHTEIGNLRTEFHTEIGELRTEVHTEIGQLRTEIGGLRTEVHTEIGGLRTEMLERFRESDHRMGQRIDVLAERSFEQYMSLSAAIRSMAIWMSTAVAVSSGLSAAIVAVWG